MHSLAVVDPLQGQHQLSHRGGREGAVTVQLSPALVAGDLLVLEVGLDQSLEGVAVQLELLDHRLEPHEDWVARLAPVASF